MQICCCSCSLQPAIQPSSHAAKHDDIECVACVFVVARIVCAVVVRVFYACRLLNNSGRRILSLLNADEYGFVTWMQMRACMYSVSKYLGYDDDVEQTCDSPTLLHRATEHTAITHAS